MWCNCTYLLVKAVSQYSRYIKMIMNTSIVGFTWFPTNKAIRNLPERMSYWLGPHSVIFLFTQLLKSYSYCVVTVWTLDVFWTYFQLGQCKACIHPVWVVGSLFIVKKKSLSFSLSQFSENLKYWEKALCFWELFSPLTSCVTVKELLLNLTVT